MPPLLHNMANNLAQQSYSSSSIKTDVDDNDTVATGATFLLITKPDGSRSCLKHPEIPIPNGIFSCPTCEAEFSQYQETLKKKKESVDLHLKEIREEQEQQQQQRDEITNAIVLRESPGKSSQYQLHSKEAAGGPSSLSTILPHQSASVLHQQQSSTTIDIAANTPTKTRSQFPPPPQQHGQMHNTTSFNGHGKKSTAAPPVEDSNGSFPPQGTNFSSVMNFSMPSVPSTSKPPASMPFSSIPPMPFSSMPSSMEQHIPPHMPLPPHMQHMNHPSNPMMLQQQQYSSFQTFTMQMQRMQQMQEWMLKQKEEEVHNLRERVEVQQKNLNEQAIQLAVFREKYQQQEQQMDRMREELKLAYARLNSDKNNRLEQNTQIKEANLNNHQTSSYNSNRWDNNDFQKEQKQLQQDKRSPSDIDKTINEKVDRLKFSSTLKSVTKEFSELPESLIFQNSENPFRQGLESNVTTAKAAPPVSSTSPVVDTAILQSTFTQPPEVTNNSKDESKRIQPQLENDGFHMIGDIIDFDDSASNAVPSIEDLTLGTALGTAEREVSKHHSLTVASSTYGEDRVYVVENSLLDPYGDKGTYTGTILKSTGMPHGKGRMVYAEDKRIYDGEWRHGRWHGYGHAFFANGDRYEGEYRFDHRHGKGKYYWNDGRIYDGIFGEDKRHGKGIFKWPDGAIYEGEFNNGQRDGQGSYTFNDGGQYVGGWKDGRYNGYGTCTWEDGRFYQGEWKDGAAHGKGVETYADGTIRHNGLWLNDQPVRDHGEVSI